MRQPNMSITILDKNKNGHFVNHNFNLIGLENTLNSSNFQVEYENACEKTTKPSKLHLLVHSFNRWDKQEFKTHLDSLQGKAVVIPTQVSENKEMIEVFQHPNINKILIFSDFLNRYFTKTLGFHADKIKQFEISLSLNVTPMYKNTKEKIILVPSLIDGLKNFEFILSAFDKIRRYNRFIYLVFLFQKDPDISDTEFAQLVNSFKAKIQDVSKWDLTDHVKVITKSEKYSYIDYLNAAHIILLPTKKVNQIYSNLILDAIDAGKAIIAPEDSFEADPSLNGEGFVFDLCKENAGMILYQPDNLQSLIEATILIQDNPPLRKILEEQNVELKNKFRPDVNTQKMTNYLKRLLDDTK